MGQNKERFDVVDALRGFAIAAILLLHNIEHFDCIYMPECLPEWMKAIDVQIWDTMFFLFGGKAYSIFAILFGFTFYIQDSHQREKGKDFRARFAWRMLLLLGFSFLNSIFFQGDILTFFAVLGLLLIPVSRLKDSVVLAITIFLLTQPLDIINMFHNFGIPSCSHLFELATAQMKETSIPAQIWSNITVGKGAVILWNIDHGRICQIPALLMAGMLIGRRGLFDASEKSKKFWSRATLFGFMVFAAFYLIKGSGTVENPTISNIIGLWSNLGLTIVIIGLFYSLFQIESWKNSLGVFIPLGKISLSCYVFSSVFGFFIYYGCGLGFYQYTGATISFCIGLALVTGLWIFSKFWSRSHTRGPLEQIWHKLTWI